MNNKFYMDKRRSYDEYSFVVCNPKVDEFSRKWRKKLVRPIDKDNSYVDDVISKKLSDWDMIFEGSIAEFDLEMSSSEIAIECMIVAGIRVDYEVDMTLDGNIDSMTLKRIQ